MKEIPKEELKLITEFLDEYADRLTNDGCNDYTLPNTPIYRQLVEEAYSSDFELPSIEKKEIWTTNWVIVRQLSEKLKNCLKD